MRSRVLVGVHPVSYWPHAPEIRVYGYGKVCATTFIHHLIQMLARIDLNVIHLFIRHVS